MFKIEWIPCFFREEDAGWLKKFELHNTMRLKELATEHDVPESCIAASIIFELYVNGFEDRALYLLNIAKSMWSALGEKWDNLAQLVHQAFELRLGSKELFIAQVQPVLKSIFGSFGGNEEDGFEIFEWLGVFHKAEATTLLLHKPPEKVMELLVYTAKMLEDSAAFFVAGWVFDLFVNGYDEEAQKLLELAQKKWSDKKWDLLKLRAGEAMAYLATRTFQPDAIRQEISLEFSGRPYR